MIPEGFCTYAVSVSEPVKAHINEFRDEKQVSYVADSDKSTESQKSLIELMVTSGGPCTVTVSL